MALKNVATELTDLTATGWAAYVGKSSDGSPDRFLSLDNFVYKTTNQTIGGVKTFTSFPVTPSSAPTTNYQVTNKLYVDDLTYIIEVAISQLDTAIAVADGIAKFPCPEDMTIQSCFINVTVAPTGSTAIFDINVEASSIMDDLITIEATEFSSLDAATQPSFTDTAVDKGEDFVIDCTQTGAVVAPQNAVLVIIYKKR